MITLYKNFSYDNNYDYVKSFASLQEQEKYFNSLPSLDIDNTNYIKTNKEIRVEYDYDFLTESGYNYLSFKNEDRTYYCFITEKEYIREDLTKLYLEIDVFQTFLFDFTLGKSFVERKVCSLSEIVDYDEGLEMGQHIIESNTVSITKNDEYFAMFSGFTDYYLNEDDTTKYIEMPFTDENKPITYVNGVPYPLLFIPLSDSGNMLLFKKNFSSAKNLVGIIRLTNVTYNTQLLELPYLTMYNNKPMRSKSIMNVCTSISNDTIYGGGVSVPKSDIFDFYPYTFYMITDFESEPLILAPQYLSDSLSVVGKISSSHSPIERYYPNYYKGSTDGKIYYIENKTISMLPCQSNGAIESLTNNLHQYRQTQSNNVLNGVISTGSAISQAMTGNVFGATTTFINGVNEIFNNLARNTDLVLTPNTVKSMGTVSTRQQYGTNTVNIIKYTIEEKYKNRIRNYISRYGNKYNNFATINLKTYKGFIKMMDIKINSKLDNIYISKIKEVLERGVYFE